MASDDQKTPELQVLEMVRDVIKFDEETRQKLNVGDKFRFVRDRLHALAERLEQHAAANKVVVEEKVTRKTATDEVMVFVYLYNVHGLNIKTWQNLLTPKVFFEYSVNRPIYTDKNHVEGLLRTKQNKVQHAYLMVAVKPADILPSNNVKDAIGNPLIKVREGALLFDQLVSFHHNDHEYTVSSKGELTKKV